MAKNNDTALTAKHNKDGKLANIDERANPLHGEGSIAGAGEGNVSGAGTGSVAGRGEGVIFITTDEAYHAGEDLGVIADIACGIQGALLDIGHGRGEGRIADEIAQDEGRIACCHIGRHEAIERLGGLKNDIGGAIGIGETIESLRCAGVAIDGEEIVFSRLMDEDLVFIEHTGDDLIGDAAVLSLFGIA